MKIYRSRNISGLTSQMEATVKGGTYIDEKSNNEKGLVDSKDVVKRKKDLRTGITFVTRSEKESSLADLSKAVSKNQPITLSAKELQFLAISFGSHIQEFTSTISGSEKYGEMVSNYLQVILIRSLLAESTSAESD